MARPVPKPLPLAGGVNLLQDQRFIADTQCISGRNIVPTRAGMAGKRLALDAVAPQSILTQNAYFLSSLTLPPANFGNGLVIAARRFDGSGTIQTFIQVIPEIYPAVVSMADVFWAQPSKYRPLLVPFNKRLYAFAGQGNLITAASPIGASTPVGSYGAIIQETTPGGTLEVVPFNFLASDGGATTEATAVPNVGAIYKNRALWGDFGPGYENYMVMSDPYLPQVVGANFLAANGRHFQVGARDGDRIVAAREIMTTSVGSADQAAALVLREYSAYLITGEPNLVDDGAFLLGDMDVNRFNIDCGCSSGDTLVNTPYGLLWAGWDDVWFFPSGQTPVRVGSNIRSLLKATPPELRYLWHASYFDGFYRLHILSPGQNEGDRTRPGEEWRLDLRSGGPRNHEEARWHGPMVYHAPDPLVGGSDDDEPGGSADDTLDTGPTWSDAGVAYAIADTRPGITPRLLGVGRGGGKDWLGQFEMERARDFESADVAGIYGAGSFIRDTEITVDWESKEYDFEDPMHEKGYAGTEINFWTSARVQVSVDDKLDGGREITTNEEILTPTGFQLDAGILDTDVLSREFQSVKIDADEDIRANAKTHQFRIYDQAGYVIDDTNNTLAFLVGAVPFTATLTQGFYDNKEALLDHVVAQMTAISGTTFSHNQTGAGLSLVVEINGADAWTTVLADTPKTWGTLGWDVTVPDAMLDPSHVAADVLFYRDAAMLEFANVNAIIYPIKRRAT